MCHGTLLGIVRDNELIPWDHDIDIAVWSDDSKRQEIIDIMSANSYELKEKYFLQEDLLTFCKKGGREVDINFYKIKDNNDNKKIAYVEWFVPKNIFYKIIDALSKSKTYQGKFKFIINKLSFSENFFLMIKKALIKKQYFFKSMGYTQPYEYLKKFKTIKFNNLKIIVPEKYEKYLSYIYGADWKTPKKNFSWIKDSPSTKEI